MTFASLNLPYSYGLGVWSQSQKVDGDDWAAAEDALTQAAQAWILDNEDRAGGYHALRDETNKLLTLDLMRGA